MKKFSTVHYAELGSEYAKHLAVLYRVHKSTRYNLFTFTIHEKSEECFCISDSRKQQGYLKWLL